MKRLILLFGCIMMAHQLFAQATRPTIMVVPSEAWCIANGYSQTFDDQGISKTTVDYTAALQNNMDLLQVISKINDLMADRGFPLKNLESVIKSINQARAESASIQSKQGGSVQRSDYDEIRDRAKADIIMQITWDIVSQGPRKSIRYNLQGLDSYTNEQVAGDSGVGEPSFAANVPTLLEEAIYSHMDNFCDRLQAHFDDIFANGRKIDIKISVFNTSQYNLESEFGGKELCEIIEDWLSENTVNHRYNISEQSENVMLVEQARIPLFDKKPMTATNFCKKLTHVLKAEPYMISSIKVQGKGLGKCEIIIGDK